jgi:hypothetical protein
MPKKARLRSSGADLLQPLVGPPYPIGPLSSGKGKLRGFGARHPWRRWCLGLPGLEAGCGSFALFRGIGVEAPAGLAAQEAGGDFLRLEPGGAKPTGPIKSLPHRLCHRVIDLYADEVHQPKRPHPKAYPLHEPVYGFYGHAAFRLPKRLYIIRPRHPIHDKARHIRCYYRLLSHLPSE